MPLLFSELCLIFLYGRLTYVKWGSHRKYEPKFDYRVYVKDLLKQTAKYVYRDDAEIEVKGS